MSKRWSLSAFALLVCASAACSQGTEPEVRRGPLDPRQDTPGTDPAEAGAVDDDAGPGDGGATPTEAGADAGADAAPPTAFSGAPAYVPTSGPATRKAGHGNNPNPAGRPCLDCHGATGGATAFTFAGTVYRNANATMPAPQVEIRVVDGAGKARSVFSNADGNFFLPLDPNGDLAFPARVGSRNAASVRLMAGALAGGNCNDCHKPGTAGRLVLP